MERAKSLILQFIVLWGCVFLLSIIAVFCGISDVDFESFAVHTTILSCIQVFLIGFKKSYSVLIYPSIVFLLFLFLLLGDDPLGDGGEAAITATHILSPYFDKLTISIIDHFSFPIRNALLFVNCAILTWLYLFLELSLARFIILKINKLKENKE